MKTTVWKTRQSGAADPAESLLSDPRALYGDRWLERKTWQAVRRVTAGIPQLHASNADGPPLVQMLALLTFCYATGLYASEDIEYALRRGRLPRTLVPRQPVTAAWLQAFRRANRPWVEQALAHLLAAMPDTAAFRARVLPGPDAQSDPVLHTGCMELARRAVELATLFDMALND